MNNIKVSPNWLKWRENWSEIISVFFDTHKYTNKYFDTNPTPQKKKYFSKMNKIKVTPNWLKWQEPLSEIIFGLFDPTPIQQKMNV